MLDFDKVPLADIDPRREVARSHAEADNHTVYMGFLGHFAIPAEGAVGKVEMHTVGEERLEEGRNILPLRDGVGRDEGGADRGILHHVGCLLIPATDVVQVAHVFPALTEDAEQVVFLLFVHQTRTHKRRVADKVIGRGADGAPVEAQGVVFGDMRLGAEGEEVEDVVDNRCRLALHARFGDPHRGARHHDGKVVDLDPVKAIDRDADRREGLAEDGHVGRVNSCGAHHLVLQPTEREVGLGQEVARSAGRVEEGHSGYALLEGQQLPTATTRFGDGFEVVKLVAQAVEEERVDDAVNVLHRGVVHAARATRFGVERALKHGAEDGGRDAAPVKLLFLVHHHQRMDGFGTELGHLHGVVRKESAVDVRQGVEFTLVTIALFLRGIEYTEEADQLEAKDVRELDEGLEVLVEESSLAEQPRVVGIEAEDDAHAEHIQAAQRLRRLRVEVFLQKQTVNLIDLLTGFDREGLFLFAETLHLAVDEEVEAVKFMLEVGQRDDARRRLGRLHIVDADAGKVADHDPSGPL